MMREASAYIKCRSLADLARILERLVRVCERGLGIAKQPQGQ